VKATPQGKAKAIVTSVIDRQTNLQNAYDDLIKITPKEAEISNTAANTPKTKKMSQVKDESQDLSGGTFVKQYSENFDLIINILINIRRSLGSLVEAPGISLEQRLYEQKITTITDYVSNKVSSEPFQFRFTDYAPFVF